MKQAANDVDQIKRLSTLSCADMIFAGSTILTGNQLRQDLRRWLSPPDPSTNHNIACSAHYEGTAAWFFQGSIFKEWKTTDSLLWIYGKRTFVDCFSLVLSGIDVRFEAGSGKSVLWFVIFNSFYHSLLTWSDSSSVIQDIATIYEAGQASMCYFYFDFRDVDKQHWHNLVHSLLTQLSARSGPRCDILSHLYANHDDGAQQPSDGLLAKCLKEMLSLPDQHPIYLIIDALDECPNSSGIPSSRQRVLVLVKELVELRLSNLHICVTSRPEIDIREILEPLAVHRVSIHDQTGQKQDIVDYVRSVVYSNSEPIMRRWRTVDKELVIETLSERADGM